MATINENTGKEFDAIRNVSFKVNLVLAIYVFFMGFAYYYCGVTYMFLHSIPTFILYLFFFWLIKSGRLDVYLLSVYILIGIYMGAATICLGYDYGFHLYCMSLIPIIFYTEYLAHKINTRKPRAFEISIFLIVIYLFSTGYTVINGPIYSVSKAAAEGFLIMNSLSVFAFLIGYTSLMIKMIIDSEKKLEKMAHYDKLTGLANRHYQMEHLENLKEEGKLHWIAIADIDKFKNINDTYGHNAGDYILVQLSSIMNNICRDCRISRWGGEEFLIVPDNADISRDILNRLREEVENHSFVYLDNYISVTISIGCADYADDNIEKWIRKADEALYKSKNTGRNKVTFYEI